jgi:hypothetical protein
MANPITQTQPSTVQTGRLCGQRDFNDVDPALLRNLTSWGQLIILRAQWTRRFRRICLNTQWESASPF